ncbi:MAG: thioredoxin family protein [Thermoplasmata archaeon]
MERFGPGAFDGQRLRRPGTCGVAFLADWCPFCRSFGPEFERLAGTGPFELAEADLTDEESPLWERFGIGVVPTVLVFRDGEMTFRRDGRLGRGLEPADLDALRAALGRSDSG